MVNDRWQKIESLFHSALERQPEERPGFLDNACDGDTELRLEVESLLANDPIAGNFLETQPSAEEFPEPGLTPGGGYG